MIHFGCNNKLYFNIKSELLLNSFRVENSVSLGFYIVGIKINS